MTRCNESIRGPFPQNLSPPGGDTEGGLKDYRRLSVLLFAILTFALTACSQPERSAAPRPGPSDSSIRETGVESQPDGKAPTMDTQAEAPLEIQREGLTSLPRPRIDHPATLMRALEKRRSTREFRDKQLPAQILSDLLWATAGVNRPDAGKRTAPSAWDRQEVDLYVALTDGLFLYRAKAHALEPIAPEDLRALTGKQGYVATAPVNLVYVADLSRMKGSSDQDRIVTSASDAGFMAQNAYLYCAAEGLAVVVRGWIDKEALGKAMKLRPEQRIVLAQSVGYSIR